MSSRPNRSQQARPERVHRGAVLQIERQQRGRAAGGADGVVGFLQPALGAGGDHHMGAAAGKLDGGGGADAAAGAGDQGDRARPAVMQRLSASRQSWRLSLSIMSGSGIG